MCLAIPGVVIDIDENRMGTIDMMGVRRRVSLELTPKAEVGGYVLVHAGFAIEVVDEKYAQDTLDLIREFPELVADQFDEAREAETGAGNPLQAEEVG